MKPPKDPRTSIEEQRQKLISHIDEMDLTKFSIQPDKLRKYRKLMLAREYEAADDFYINTVMGAIIESDRKEYYKDVVKFRYKIRGKSRGEQKTNEANEIKTWLYPLLAECEAEFPPERIQKGWRTMRTKAIKKVTKENLDDPRKKYLTRSRIQTWIDDGRPKI
jgi:hypothetical protein